MTVLTQWKNYAWVVIMMIIAAMTTFATDGNVISFIIAACGIIAPFLAAQHHAINFLFGFINVVLYAYVSCTFHLYGTAVLNALFYAPMQIIGYIMWRKHSTGDVTHPQHMTKNAAIITLYSIPLSTGIMAIILSSVYSSSPVLNAAVVSISIVGQILMTWRFPQQWMAWISVNIASLVMWITTLSSSDHPQWSIVVMWTAKLINSIYRWYQWRGHDTSQQ